MKKFKVWLEDRNLKIEESMVNEISILDISKRLADVPENIVASLYKAIRIMKATAFIAALIYMGFRIEKIRLLFPWLTPFIDRAGEFVIKAGSDFLKSSFDKLQKMFPDLVDWLSEKMGVKTAVNAMSKVGKTIEGPRNPIYDQINKSIGTRQDRSDYRDIPPGHFHPGRKL
jgi:hypothetical protein